MAPTSCTSQEMVSPFTDDEMEVGEMVAEVSQVLRSEVLVECAWGSEEESLFYFSAQ